MLSKSRAPVVRCKRCPSNRENAGQEGYGPLGGAATSPRSRTFSNDTRSSGSRPRLGRPCGAVSCLRRPRRRGHPAPIRKQPHELFALVTRREAPRCAAARPQGPAPARVTGLRPGSDPRGSGAPCCPRPGKLPGDIGGSVSERRPDQFHGGGTTGHRGKARARCRFRDLRHGLAPGTYRPQHMPCRLNTRSRGVARSHRLQRSRIAYR